MKDIMMHMTQPSYSRSRDNNENIAQVMMHIMQSAHHAGKDHAHFPLTMKKQQLYYFQRKICNTFFSNYQSNR